ncbi:ATP-grasp domain-containing protein [Saccharothrix longispora]|uniref:ATP-grasp domain-containing protein n=1 Tax=Saccharothrix longispora TaxID=33920 RepID=A0ABU1PRE7_9PSEU|nr:ATP-grasp domain-containing protein [Saccharothrix longispora]MDR6592689.1 hypothetical protein [Saccharothrix longispora]
MRAVLLLGHASGTPHGRDQLRRVSAQVRRRGLRLVGADAVAATSDLVDETAVFDVHDPAAARVWAAARSVRFDAVMTFREMCVESVAAIADELGLPGNPPRAVRTVRTKDLCREVLREAGLPQPACAVVSDVDGARAALTGPGPWIVKPRDAMGSVGVSLVSGVDDLPAAVAALPDASGPFLVEEFVTGPEYSAEGVFVGGEPVVIGLTAKSTGPGFVETGHRMPAVLDPATDAAARAEVARALRAAGLTHGIFHVEFWLTPAPVLGELHARPGGDFIHAMLEHVHPGLELYGTLVDDLLGVPPAPVPPAAGAAAVHFPPVPPGTVTAVEGWPGPTTPGLLAAHLSAAPGATVRPVAHSADRPAVLVVGAPGAAEVDDLLEGLAGGVRIEVRPEER